MTDYPDQVMTHLSAHLAISKSHRLLGQAAKAIAICKELATEHSDLVRAISEGMLSEIKALADSTDLTDPEDQGVYDECRNLSCVLDRSHFRARRLQGESPLHALRDPRE
jgi:hypothetical protein